MKKIDKRKKNLFHYEVVLIRSNVKNDGACIIFVSTRERF